MLFSMDRDESMEYEIEILKIDYSLETFKNMTIRITDPALIEITGGIVKGMSGSPIIQNGMFVGAMYGQINDEDSKGIAIFGIDMINNIFY